jgi:hypothetical protein
MNGGLRKGSIFLCGPSVRGLLSGDPEGHGEEGSGDGYVRSPGTLIVERGLCRRGISLYGNSVRGTCRGGSFVGDLKRYERRALGMGISLCVGSVGQPGVDSSTGTSRYG